ncbi:MAG: hypothetical protein AAF513_05575 [Pseudomonadota bacterium]
MSSVHELIVVTDPMCSWCWGMAAAIQTSREQLADRAHFELMLGGINTHGTQPIGDYGRRFLMRLWREVHETTGQPFGFKLPETYVHNSVAPCVAIEYAREVSEVDPLDVLHLLQERFFVHGEDITDIELLTRLLETFDIDSGGLEGSMRDPNMKARLQFQFDNAGAFGTQAMPSLLIRKEEGLKLFAGGYMDADMLASLLP